MTCSFSGSKCSVRPKRYEALARCTSVQDMCPSSMGAFKSSLRRLRRQSMKLAQLFPSRVARGPGTCSRPSHVLYDCPSPHPRCRWPCNLLTRRRCRRRSAFRRKLFVCFWRTHEARYCNTEAWCADAGLVIRKPVAHLEFEHLVFAHPIKLKGAAQGVGRLLVVIEHEMPAHGRHLDGYLTPSPQRATSI